MRCHIASRGRNATFSFMMLGARGAARESGCHTIGGLIKDHLESKPGKFRRRGEFDGTAAHARPRQHICYSAKHLAHSATSLVQQRPEGVCLAAAKEIDVSVITHS